MLDFLSLKNGHDGRSGRQIGYVGADINANKWSYGEREPKGIIAIQEANIEWGYKCAVLRMGEGRCSIKNVVLKMICDRRIHKVALNGCSSIWDSNYATWRVLKLNKIARNLEKIFQLSKVRRYIWVPNTCESRKVIRTTALFHIQSSIWLPSLEETEIRQAILTRGYTGQL